MASLARRPLLYPELLESMAESLRHRGPDSQGIYRRPNFGLGCQRLRIIDLHKRADQPFCDPQNRFWLVCNGEIYNAEELRQRYSGYPYRSRCDVEAILPLFLDRGVEGLSELDGMFGLAIWDEEESSLILARDRAGEKPLFYGRVDEELWFASEVQTLLVGSVISRAIDEDAIFQYLALGYVREPRTTFTKIRKIEAGTIVRFSSSDESTTRYWAPETLLRSPASLPPQPAEVRSLLQRAVRKQMVADVPVGVFVSGGLDSTVLAHLVAQEAKGPIHTFVARFGEGSYDESTWAADCARRLGTDHREVLVDQSSLREALVAVTENLAEPLADPAILPTYLLAREARRHVTVVLSGEGADELFGGYPTYLGHQLIPFLRLLPSFVSKLSRSVVDRMAASRSNVTVGFLLKRLLAHAEKPWVERHFGWFGTGAQATLGGSYDLGMADIAKPFTELLPGSISGAMLLDYFTYLRDSLLVKIDRATMLNALEARAPFLDHRLTAYAMAMPECYKVRRLTTKWLLKNAVQEWVPRAVIQRRKRGLGVPVAAWMDGALRPEVDRLLAPERLAYQELFDPLQVGVLLAEHRAGRANHARALWALVMFQYWLERWIPERASCSPGDRQESSGGYARR